jgi:hypothetical protein
MTTLVRFQRVTIRLAEYGGRAWGIWMDTMPPILDIFRCDFIMKTDAIDSYQSFSYAQAYSLQVDDSGRLPSAFPAASSAVISSFLIRNCTFDVGTYAIIFNAPAIAVFSNSTFARSTFVIQNATFVGIEASAIQAALLLQKPTRVAVKYSTFLVATQLQITDLGTTILTSDPWDGSLLTSTATCLKISNSGNPFPALSLTNLGLTEESCDRFTPRVTVCDALTQLSWTTTASTALRAAIRGSCSLTNDEDATAITCLPPWQEEKLGGIIMNDLAGTQMCGGLREER